ncbi:MAG: transketolase [Alphaproteobacteria bacterium]|nr:transketolase [Alphaproteobacteria bacterium]
MPHVNRVAVTIRRLALAAIYQAGSGHPGGALSCADLLACLYGTELYFPGNNPAHPGRDRFVLSKGHAAPALYAAWAAIGLARHEDVVTLRKLGSPMQGHPHVLDLPLCETSTGSLGQGFSAAIGMALGLRMKRLSARTYVMLGDGELQEGEVWEGAMFAAHHRLSNLCALIDYNKMQSDDLNERIMGLEPLAEKWRAFGWHVEEVNGHRVPEILDALRMAAGVADRPSVIIAHTIKGKGVAQMEGNPAWHGSVKLSREQIEAAMRNLGVLAHEMEDWIHGRIV